MFCLGWHPTCQLASPSPELQCMVADIYGRLNIKVGIQSHPLQTTTIRLNLSEVSLEIGS